MPRPFAVAIIPAPVPHYDDGPVRLVMGRHGYLHCGDCGERLHVGVTAFLRCHACVDARRVP